MRVCACLVASGCRHLPCLYLAFACTRIRDVRRREKRPVRRREKRQGVVKVNAAASLVMDRARFSLGRQTPARRSTLIPSTPLRGIPRAAALRSFYDFLGLYSLCCGVSSHYVPRTHPPTLRSHSCPRARHEILYGLRGGKDQSLSVRCTEPARCTVSCKLSGVSHPV
jgi:hypothetical protein